MESGSTPPEANGGSADDRIPRGAIAVVVVGLLACIAAALLTGGSASGEAAHLEFVQGRKMPGTAPVAVPGAKEGAQMRLLDGRIEATGTNVAGYELFRVLTTLEIDKGAPVGSGKVICSIHAAGSDTLIGQSSNGLRTLYPRSSEDGIYGQPVPGTVLVKFASHGYELAVLEVEEGMPERFTTILGVKLNWPEYEVGTEHLEYFLPEGKPKNAIKLPFYAIWRATTPPQAKVSCELKVAAGNGKVKTEGSLPLSPPIDEEAEEIAEQEREENGEVPAEGEEGSEEEAESSEGE
jgi:hypothetical protein